jgi:hypothetical protein
MPNHTSQILTVDCDKKTFNKIKKAVKGKKQAFDQDAFFPMPEEIRNTQSPVTIISDEDYVKFQNGEEVTIRSEFGHVHTIKKSEDPDSMFASKPISESMNEKLLMEHGCNNWYDWAHKHWGTKWGVYHCGKWNIKEQSIYFQSAWSPATEIIEKLSTMFPEVNFVLDAADEGGGFLLTQDIKGGEVISELNFDWNSDEGIELRDKLGVYYPENEEQEA